jgi:uncharacterized protein YndB with AHSA1/START domain
MSVSEGSVDLTKMFDVPVDKVFAAWADQNAQLAWSDPGEGWSMTFDAFSFAIGETDSCRFGPDGGPEYINENRYLAIESCKRIVYWTSLMTGGRIIFAGTVAATFEAIGEGTRMRLIENGLYLDGLDDAEGHRSGWQSMLGALDVYLRH